MKKVLAVCLGLLGCAGDDPADGAPGPVKIDECEGLPALTLTPSRSQARVQSAVTLHADGGSGRYRYALEPGGSGGELRDDRLITGATPGTDKLTASDDCGHSASTRVEVRGAFEVSPARAELRTGTRFTLEVSGNLGDVRCEAQALGSGGSVSEDCAYVAGDQPGLDVIRVSDRGSGDQLAVQYEVTASAGLRGAPARLALPRGASVTLHTAGGSDAISYRLLQGPGALDGALYRATLDKSSERLALIEAEDRFTRERTQLVVQILEELGGADKPHGRLTDQGSIATADFDGDGREDLALGVPESDLGKPSGGAVFIWKGGADGLAQEPTWTLTGQSDTANLGAVLAAGDLDGDGRAELAISEPGADITVADSGAVAIYTWSATGPVLQRPALTGVGPSKFGAALAIADVNADGVQDLLVGSPGGDLAPSASVKERGVVDVFLLSKGKSIPDFASLRIGGSNLAADGKLASGSGLRFGRALAVGDYNGDGRADLASLGAVDNAAVGGMNVARNQLAIALHFGRAASQPFAAAPDLFIAPANLADGNEGSYRLFTGPAVDGGAQRLLVAADRIDAPDLSASGGQKAQSDAGGVYVYDLRMFHPEGEPAAQPAQLGREQAFARVYGDVASGAAARSLTFADLDGDAALDLVLGAPLAARPSSMPKGASAPLTGKLIAYPYQTLTQGAQLGQPLATRWGQAQADTFGVAVSTWSPRGQPGLVVLAGRASTALGDFTGRLDAFVGELGRADLTAQSAALPARLASQQRGAAVALTRSGSQLQALVGVPGFSGAGSRNDGDDLGAGRALLFSPGEDPRVIAEGAATAHSAGDHAAYGGRQIGSDVAFTDFDGDGRQDLIVAAPQLSTPIATSSDYASIDMSCVAASAQGNGGALVFLAQADGSYKPGFRAFALADIAGCTPAGDARCKRKELARYGLAGGFDFDGDGKQDLLLSRANGLELFLGRARVDSDKPAMVCNPAWSLPALAQPVSAPAALGDLDGDGCDEVALRYADGQRSGLLIGFGFSAAGGCKGHAQPAWLRIAGDGEVGVTNMQLGIASARAGKLFADDRDCVAISAGLYPFEGTRQPAVLLFDVKQLAAKRPASGEALIGALDPGLSHWPLVYRERAPGFGRALAGNVDLDGDGVVDLVVSAPGASINGDGAGAVFAFRGVAAFGGRMDAWLAVLGDPAERASVGQDLSVLAGSGDASPGLAIGAPLSDRSGTANGTAFLLQLERAP